MGIILALSDWVLYGRTVRARALAEKTHEYVEAAKVLNVLGDGLRELWKME